MKKSFTILSKRDEDVIKYDIRVGNVRTRPKKLYTDTEDMIFKKLFEKLIKKDNLFKYTKEKVERTIFVELGKPNYSENDVKIFNDVYQTLKNIEKQEKVILILERGEKFLPLNREKILRGILLGAFGTGKSAKGKDLSDLDDDINIPVVGVSRTSIFDASYVYILDKNRDKSFKYYANFKDKKDIEFLIKECIDRAVLETIGTKEELTTSNLISAFLRDPENLFRIQYLVGKYYKKPKNDFQILSTKYWSEIVEEIKVIREKVFKYVLNKSDINLEYTEKNYKDLIDEIEKGLQDNESEHYKLRDKTSDAIVQSIMKKIEEICLTVSKIEGSIVKVNDEIIGFEGVYTREDIENTLNLFITNNPKNYGQALTPIVSYLRVEVPLSNELDDDILGRLNKSGKNIVLDDTIGKFHGSSTPSESVGGLIDINFDDYDFVLILDNALKSMSKETEMILKEVKNCSIYEKIFLLYSHFDEFEKEELEDDDEKKEYLINIQKSKLKAIEDSFDIMDFIEALERNTLFLGKAKISNNPEKREYEYNILSNLLNKIMDNFNEINQIVFTDKKIEKSKEFIEYNNMKLGIIYADVQKKFIELQRKIYIESGLQWKIPEALTNRLGRRKSVYYGSTVTLTPLDDFQRFLGEKLAIFIKNPSLINFKYSENELEKFIEVLKEMIMSDVKLLIKEQFLENKYEEWWKAYCYSGGGSDWKRKTKIMKEFNEIVPMIMDNNNYFSADIWLYEIDRIIKENIRKLEKLEKKTII